MENASNFSDELRSNVLNRFVPMLRPGTCSHKKLGERCNDHGAGCSLHAPQEGTDLATPCLTESVIALPALLCSKSGFSITMVTENCT